MDRNKKELTLKYGKQKANAYVDFHDKLLNIKNKYSDFLKENNLDFELLYEFQFTEYDVSFNVINQEVLNTPVKDDLDSAFSESFSSLLK